jgi:hypothetical protein
MFLIPLLTLVELCQVAFLIHKRYICTKTARVLISRFFLRFPLALFDLIQSRIPFIGVAAIIFSSVIFFWFMAFVLGAFTAKTWVLSGIVIGSSTISPGPVTGWTREIIGSLAGFAAGSVTFLLDWPVCWKEPPVSSLVGLVVGSFAGGLLDLLKRWKLQKKSV